MTNTLPLTAYDATYNMCRIQGTHEAYSRAGGLAYRARCALDNCAYACGDDGDAAAALTAAAEELSSLAVAAMQDAAALRLAAAQLAK